ncbi:hypothetical protein R3P38DRAFT_3323036 [Favolaschia claudopus]|uniref:Uncharacterized protein n=1 Tax=Favolaschia claudopus TaxID=2862362 RepID=A0AAW0AJF0_9AGAR
MSTVVRLSEWTPSTRRLKFVWKPIDYDEMKNYDIPFAIKEYLQNIAGQVKKKLHIREWNDWSKENLFNKTDEERQARKASLIASFPGMLTGPYASHLIRQYIALPLYVLTANVAVPHEPNFMAAVVLWTAMDGMRALSFFNNHLDDSASFESFVKDGDSTSRYSPFPVAQTGKGFILATQFLVQEMNKNALAALPADAKIRDLPNANISFRVGSQIGELKWSRGRKPGAPITLNATLDDLTLYNTQEEYIEARYHQEIDASGGGDPNTYDGRVGNKKKRLEDAAFNIARMKKLRIQYGLDRADSTSAVLPDEVCISVLRLPPKHTPEYLFSAVFGIFPPTRQWRLDNSNVVFFMGAHSAEPRFYYRDQYVQRGIRLAHISINYHGELELSPDHTAIVRDKSGKLEQYTKELGRDADEAFRTLPDLAGELAVEILLDDHPDALARILRPRDKQAAAQYRTAFKLAMQRVFQLAGSDRIYPHTQTESDLSIFPQLGLHPVLIGEHAFQVIHESGAYLPIAHYARQLNAISDPLREQLLNASEVPNYPGLSLVRILFKSALPSLPSANISVREFRHLHPRSAWSPDYQNLAFAVPRDCDEHGLKPCFCWLGPTLAVAADEYKGSPRISAENLWTLLANLMGRHLGMETALPTMKGCPGLILLPVEAPYTSAVALTTSRTSTMVNTTSGAFQSSAPPRMIDGSRNGYTQPLSLSKRPGQPAVDSILTPKPRDISAAQQDHLPGIEPRTAADDRASVNNALAQLSLHFKSMHDQVEELQSQVNKSNDLITAKDQNIVQKDERIVAKDVRIAELEEDMRRLLDLGNVFSENVAQFSEVKERAVKRQRAA